MARRHQTLIAGETLAPPFLLKTYDLISDPQTDDVVGWTEDGRSFVVYMQDLFSRSLLPQYFKHNNFSSFVRQLNTYGFRKVDADRWEFSQEFFRKGRPDLLVQIQRRRAGTTHVAHSAAAQSAIEVGQFGGLADDVESLKRDKNVLMVELVRVRKQQEESNNQINLLHSRLDASEERETQMLQRQDQMVQFLSKALQHPEVLSQLVGARQRISSGAQPAPGRKKLKRRVARDDSSVDSGGDHSDVQPDEGKQLVQYQPGAAAKPPFMDRLLQRMGGFEADSTPARAHPEHLAEMGTALNGMSLAQDAPKHGSWQSSVQIAEHDPAAAGMMPLIPHHNGAAMSQLSGSSLRPRGGEAAASASAPPATAVQQSLQQQQQQLDQEQAAGGLGAQHPGQAMSGEVPEDLLLSSLGDLDGLDLGSGSGDAGAFDDIFGLDAQLPPASDAAAGGAGQQSAAQRPPPGGGSLPASDRMVTSPLQQQVYNAQDFNHDLLHAADGADGGLMDLPQGMAGAQSGPASDADLWRHYMVPNSPEASA